jgi:hypothetical protein
MNTLTVALAESLVVTALFAVPSFAEDEEALKDLTAVIALHGLPCGQVVTAKVQAENDYAAACKDGNKYHVYLMLRGGWLSRSRSERGAEPWCEVAEAASSMDSALVSSIRNNFAERISSMSARADPEFRAVLQLEIIAALDENRSGPGACTDCGANRRAFAGAR